MSPVNVDDIFERAKNSFRVGVHEAADAVVESVVIDSLKNLTIIKESTVDVTAAGKKESDSQEKRGARNGS